MVWQKCPAVTKNQFPTFLLVFMEFYSDYKCSCCYIKHAKILDYFPSIIQKDMINPFYKPLKNMKTNQCLYLFRFGFG